MLPQHYGVAFAVLRKLNDLFGQSL